MGKSDRKPILLLVDDEVDMLQLMQVSLHAEGYKVKISPNGDDLLDMLVKEPPDLVLLDIRMDGVDGGTICHLLKHNKSTVKIPILIFSANDNIATITRECGADGCIKKPFRTEKLREELNRILGPDHAVDKVSEEL
jgi:DNA-binding response OmpR family regulator